MKKGLTPNRWVQTIALALPIMVGLSISNKFVIIGIICSLMLFWIFRGERN